jgi:hypothetical protein
MRQLRLRFRVRVGLVLAFRIAFTAAYHAGGEAQAGETDPGLNLEHSRGAFPNVVDLPSVRRGRRHLRGSMLGVHATEARAGARISDGFTTGS